MKYFEWRMNFRNQACWGDSTQGKGKTREGVVLRASENFPKLLPVYTELSEYQAVVQWRRNFRKYSLALRKCYLISICNGTAGMAVKPCKSWMKGTLRASLHLKKGCNGPMGTSRLRKDTPEVPMANECQEPKEPAASLQRSGL